jgi:signal transduction histidine kinase/streptogramin lyase
MKQFIPPPVWLLLILLSVALSAQAERLPVKIYTSADGLGSSFVSYLMVDSRGFLWVCTRDGLSRFDGARFVTYRVGDANAPPGIQQIIETGKGIYWIVTTGGLYRFDPNVPIPPIADKTGDRPTLNARFVSDATGFLFEDHSGSLWLAGDHLERIIEKDGKTILERVELNLPLNLSQFFRACEGQDGSFWLLANLGLIRRFPDGQEVFYAVDDSRTNLLVRIVEDRSGRIWIGAQKGVYVIRPESRDELTISAAGKVRPLDQLARQLSRSQASAIALMKPGEILEYRDPEGFRTGSGSFLYRAADAHIWISNTRTISEFDGQTFHTYTPAQGFLEMVVQFVEDGGNNLWLGGSNGLMRLDRGGLTSYLTSDGLADPNILVVNQTRDGRLFVMTRDLSLSLFEDVRFQTIRPSLPTDAQTLWMANPAFQDSTGEWWFPTLKKLYRFAALSDFRELARQGPRASYDSRDGLKSNMFQIWEDSHHDLWISTRGWQNQASLSRWRRAEETFYAFSEADGFPSNRAATSFAEDSQGRLWFGFYDGGLVRYADGRFTEFTSADGAPSGVITALHIDALGRLWAGSSQSGLSRIDDLSASHLRFVNITSQVALASNNVRSITEDLFGNIYAGTARGIDRISPDATRLKHFSISDGLAGDFVVTSFRDRSGALWFGTPNGLSRLVPTQTAPVTAPAVWISGLRIAGERRPVSEMGSAELFVSELGYSQNNLQIDFFGINFSAGESLRYQYKLEGADRDWSTPAEQRTVTFANLQPGRYRFLVRTVNADGLAGQKPATVSFRILAPVWQRWWFITLCTLLVGAILLSVYRYRVARLRDINAALLEAKLAEENLRKANEARLVELEHVRKRIATDLHDDIGSSLTRISLLSEVAQRREGKGDKSGPGSLSTIAGLSRELVDSMSDIVWAINPERDHLADLTQRMRHFASDVFAARGIESRFHFPDFEQSIQVGANFRRELFLIFKEAVNNVVRHSECTEAEIEFTIDGGGVRLQLRDNGRGFDVLSKSDGHGLASMLARAKALGGKLEIGSDRGCGTTLVFIIPLSPQDGRRAHEKVQT